MAQEIRETDPEMCLHFKDVFGIYVGGSALYERTLTCLVQALQGLVC